MAMLFFLSFLLKKRELSDIFASECIYGLVGTREHLALGRRNIGLRKKGVKENGGGERDGGCL